MADPDGCLTLPARAAVALQLLLLGACAGPEVPQYAGTPDETVRFRAVLVAGDGQIRAFDNGVARMQDWLVAVARVPPHQVTRLSARRRVVTQANLRPATLANVTQAIAALRPGPGEGCFVFITSHGTRGKGVDLAWNQEALTPAALDAALTQGCGDAPTVAIVSACFAGSFARAPMAQANRVILTAARPDRPSFGCGAGDEYTYFDQCLLDNLHRGPRWTDVYAAVADCVAAREQARSFAPSEPQAAFGTVAGRLRVPGGGT